jgi:4-hydroxy-tetrahydrodipicolinate synthase
VLFGTTGEGTSFSAAERLATVEALLKAGIPASRMGLGAGFPALTDSVALTRSALALGLRHMLLLPPYFYRDASAEGIEDAFAAILDDIADDRLRATLYHIPQTSGVGVPASVAASLRAHYGRSSRASRTAAPTSSSFRRFAPLRRIWRSPWATRSISPARWRRAAPARSVALATSSPIWCGPCSMAVMPEPQLRAVLSVIGDLPFTPALKAILAAQTGDAGWLRVRAPLRAISDGAALTAKLDSLSRAVAA